MDVIWQIRQDQLMVNCNVLVKWARVASTYGPPDATGQPTFPLAVNGGLRVPLADEQLAARRWNWVVEDLPALGHTGTTLERQFLQQNAVFGNLLQQQVENAQAARAADRAPKEFSDVYPQAAVEIQMLCEVAMEAYLPPIWMLLANLKKKEAVMAASQLIEARAPDGNSYKVAPVVTPELLERIYSFKAGSVDVDDITAGFSLFLLSTGSPEANTQARKRSVVYRMLHGGQVAPSLDQLREIVTTAPQMARTLIGLERNYQGYSTLLDVLLGVNHWVALYFPAFVDSFHSLKLGVEEQFGAEIHAALPLFQRHTQLTMARYYNDATAVGANAGLPRITDLIDIIKYRQWSQLPQLSPHYTNTRGSPSGTPTTPSGGGRASGTGTGTASRAGGGGNTNTRVVNVAPNTVLMARFEHMTKRLGDITRNETLFIPRGNNGTEVLCLSHILRGECNTTCRRAATHRVLTQTKQSHVGDFLMQVGFE
jgi:hypothetical protein